MGLAVYYLQIKAVHVTCVLASGGLFAVRGTMGLAGIRTAHGAVLRYLSYAVDTALLTAALMLVTILHQYPFVQAWLTVKVIAVAVYIGFGAMALRRDGRRPRRAGWFAAAVAVYLFILGVAHAHAPLGVFATLFR